MTIIYILILIAAAFVEISDKCNTHGTIKKVGLAFVMIGALVHLANRHNNMIEIGLCLVLAAEILQAYLHKRNRRQYDNEKVIL